MIALDHLGRPTQYGIGPNGDVVPVAVRKGSWWTGVRFRSFENPPDRLYFVTDPIEERVEFSKRFPTEQDA